MKVKIRAEVILLADSLISNFLKGLTYSAVSPSSPTTSVLSSMLSQRNGKRWKWHPLLAAIQLWLLLTTSSLSSADRAWVSTLYNCIRLDTSLWQVTTTFSMFQCFRSAIQHQDMEDEPVTKHPVKCDNEVGSEALPWVAPWEQTVPQLLWAQQKQFNMQSKYFY